MIEGHVSNGEEVAFRARATVPPPLLESNGQRKYLLILNDFLDSTNELMKKILNQ